MESPHGNALPGQSLSGQSLSGQGLSGRGISLVEALAYANTPRQQLEATHAYWRLVARVANYNLQCRLVRRLDISGVAPADLPVLKTAQASAAAALQEARCEAIAAQHDLAQAAMLPLANSLPLPTDLPHVGTYHTHFAEMFSTKPAPPAARLIDRVLPIYCKAIDARGRAIAASQQSFDAAWEAYRTKQAGLDAVVARAASLGRQHRALVNSVRDYNHEIAEYAVASLSRPVSPTALVSMLIKTKNNTPGHFNAINVPATAVRPTRNQPTLAPPRGRVRRLSHDEPATHNPLQPIPLKGPPVENPLRSEPRHRPPIQQPLQDEPKRLPEAEEPFQNEPKRLPAAEEPFQNKSKRLPAAEELPRADRAKRPETAIIHTRSIVPVQAKPQPHSSPGAKRQWETPVGEMPVEKTPVEKTPVERSVKKPPLDSQGGLRFPSGKSRPSGLYTALADASDSDRASRLTNILHRNRDLAADMGPSIELADYLALGNNRQTMVEAFWLARQRAAEYQTLTRQARLLDELRFTSSPRHVAARLAATRLATEAEMSDAHIRLIKSQYRLANLVGKTSESAWPMAATTPRSTAYNAAAGPSRRGQIDTSDTQTPRTWTIRRLRAVIPSMHNTLCRRAAAVVEADTARAAATAGLQTAAAGQKPGAAENRVLDCTIRQTEETMSLLASLTDYNNAIARHALGEQPPMVSSRSLAEMLLD